MGMVKVDFKQLKDFQKKLQQSQKQVQPTLQDIADDIANEYLQKVKARNPNTNTNELKNNWKTDIVETENGYDITIYNNTEYASQIEYGSRTADGGFKQGKFMLHITEQEMEKRIEQIAEKILKICLRGFSNDNQILQYCKC